MCGSAAMRSPRAANCLGGRPLRLPACSRAKSAEQVAARPRGRRPAAAPPLDGVIRALLRTVLTTIRIVRKYMY